MRADVHTLRVNEIFYSIQGEATHVGRPCVFVRLTGCDLRCRWCDTAYAFHEGRPMSPAEILDEVTALGCPLVQVTGGEPLLQRGAPRLVRSLLDEGYEVLVETGGHRDVGVLDPRARIIMDLKCPSSGETDKNLLSNVEQLRREDEVKFVICDRTDYEWAQNTVVPAADGSNADKPAVPSF